MPTDIKTLADSKQGVRLPSGKRHRGFTLVELMVAMTITLIILLAVTQVFSTSRSTYTMEEGLARVQESGRFAMNFLTYELRMAGNAGCLSKTTTVTNHLNNPSDYSYDFQPGKYLNGHFYDATMPNAATTDWEPDLPTAYFADDEVVPGTDVIVVRRVSQVSLNLNGPMSPDSSASIAIVSNPGGLERYDIVMVGDCKNADIFQITNPASIDSGTNNIVHNTGEGNPGNATKPLSKIYDVDAEMYKLITHVYYIGRRGNIATNPPALFRKELDTTVATTSNQGAMVAQELVEGVEQMRVRYGIDTDGDRVANRYVDAKTAEAGGLWPSVVSVRVGILVKTLETVETVDDAKQFTLADNTIAAANDKFRRRAFNATIQLRN